MSSASRLADGLADLTPNAFVQSVGQEAAGEPLLHQHFILRRQIIVAREKLIALYKRRFLEEQRSVRYARLLIPLLNRQLAELKALEPKTDWSKVYSNRQCHRTSAPDLLSASRFVRRNHLISLVNHIELLPALKEPYTRYTETFLKNARWLESYVSRCIEGIAENGAKMQLGLLSGIELSAAHSLGKAYLDYAFRFRSGAPLALTASDARNKAIRFLEICANYSRAADEELQDKIQDSSIPVATRVGLAGVTLLEQCQNSLRVARQ